MKRKPTPDSAPRMFEAVEYVRSNPGCPKLHVAEHVGPHGSRKFGYQTVDRAIKAGLIEAERLPSGTYRLTVSD